MRAAIRIAALGGIGLAAALLAPTALALDYRSVGDNVAPMFDAPSQKAKPLYSIVRGTPVEVVVSLERWSKVRDSRGDIAWIEKRALAENRTVIVSARTAEVRDKPDAAASLVFEAEQDVVLELVEAGPAGWAKVRHRDGQQGFVRASQVWGL